MRAAYTEMNYRRDQEVAAQPGTLRSGRVVSGVGESIEPCASSAGSETSVQAAVVSQVHDISIGRYIRMGFAEQRPDGTEEVVDHVGVIKDLGVTGYLTIMFPLELLSPLAW